MAQDMTGDVAQALSPVTGEQAKRNPESAKPALASYRRNLPHFQHTAKTLFVTFSTYKRWPLPGSVRGAVLEHCLREHGLKLMVHGVVVMPDHVHMVFTQLHDAEGCLFGLAEIMRGIKGASARTVNRMLRRQGHVWQDESFDHILRSDEGVRQKVEYICDNPVRKGLVRNCDEYPWLWREWVEGEGGTGRSACATQDTAEVAVAQEAEER